MSQTSGTPPRWTPGDWRVLEVVAAAKGWTWTTRHAFWILEEARMLEGDLETAD
jgi:hypothetical protein